MLEFLGNDKNDIWATAQQAWKKLNEASPITQNFNLPSSVSLITLCSALGFANHVFNNKGYFKNRGHFEKIIFGITICLVSIVSYLTTLKHSHLQQLLTSGMTFVWGLVHIIKQDHGAIMNNVINAMKQNQTESTQQQQKQKVIPKAQRLDDYEEKQDVGHHQQQQHASLFSQHQQQQQPLRSHQQQQQHGNQQQQQQQQLNKSINGMDLSSRKVLLKAAYWLKQGIYTFISLLPMLLLNNADIDRTRPDVSLPQSAWHYFTSFFKPQNAPKPTDHAFFDYHTLSWINLIGAVVSMCAFMIYHPQSRFAKNIQNKLRDAMPFVSNGHLSGFIQSVGMCLTAWRTTSPTQYLSLLAPAATYLGFLFKALQHWVDNHNVNNAKHHTSGAMPSITNNIDTRHMKEQENSAVNKVLHDTRYLLPFTY